MSRLSTLVLILFVPFQLANAITATDLPNQLQGCIISSTCVVDTSMPVASFGQMEAYLYADLSVGGTTGYAVRYSLLPPSARYNNDALLRPFTGDVWLTVQDTYNLAGDSNRLTVYTDTVNPQPANLLLNDSNALDINIDMSNAALLSGSGFHQTSFNDLIDGIPPGGNMVLWSDLFGNELVSAVRPCLADGCLTTVTLNLLHLNYVDAGDGTASLIFNSADTRALLYETISGDFDFFVDRQSYYVAPVPVPTTIWLFGSGLIGLIGLARRKAHI